MTLSAKKPISEAYPKTLQTMGDHLRKKRLDLKLFQKDVAKVLGVSTDTVTIWEKNRGGPALRFIPRIITFLGYDPGPQSASSLGQKIKLYRRSRGLSIVKLAMIWGVDPTTLSRWERGEYEPHARMRIRINRMLGDDVPTSSETERRTLLV